MAGLGDMFGASLATVNGQKPRNSDRIQAGQPLNLRGAFEAATNIPVVGDALSGGMAIYDAAKGEYGSAAMNALGVLPFVSAGMVKGVGKASDALPMDEVSRMSRMQDMGMERGWFRGGNAPVDGKKTGNWYTKDRDEAESYAKNRGGDVREYAVPAGNYIDGNKSYGSKLTSDLAKVLDDPYFDKAGQGLAAEFRRYGPDERINGNTVWQALESRFGNDGAGEVIEKLGFFKGAKGITGGPEVMVFPGTPVRDAEKAVFNPLNSFKNDIYGKATLPALGLAGSVGAGAMYALPGIQGNQPAYQDRKP